MKPLKINAESWDQLPIADGAVGSRNNSSWESTIFRTWGKKSVPDRRRALVESTLLSPTPVCVVGTATCLPWTTIVLASHSRQCSRRGVAVTPDNNQGASSIVSTDQWRPAATDFNVNAAWFLWLYMAMMMITKTMEFVEHILILSSFKWSN